MNGNLNFLDESNVEYLIVHCSDTPDDEILDSIDIHRMHLGFGWNGIGYHRLIKRDGEVQSGRPDYWIGAHVFGFNNVSLGVCLIGRNQFTKNQLKSLEKVLRSWKKKYLNAKIIGHCDLPNTEKTCPNFDVSHWCQNIGLE